MLFEHWVFDGVAFGDGGLYGVGLDDGSFDAIGFGGVGFTAIGFDDGEKESRPIERFSTNRNRSC